ncbi:hypothetical protein [Ktedonobacter racemifer]|uniref:Uncharacterized protein n=1 Tax=Ktedonobacter racemifer DSM 44963 TaxID=485913 RepID=D6U268_KTERA|nr:hypothetical protein [Ktedonobacter racemifer]EFH82736.1 hypothetical protein Krac_3579 [Ktedonobacter racemifer DSM 44963]
MEEKPKSCALMRHQKFVRDAVCLVCNPSLHPQSLRQILLDPATAVWYQSLVAGTYCHWLRCEKPGVFFDQLPDGHWWCDEHRYHGFLLQEGAALDFPAWEYFVGHTILAGRPNWYKSTTHASPEDVQCRVAKLRGISVEELRAQVEPQPAPAVGNDSLIPTPHLVDGGIEFAGEVYGVLPLEIRDMLKTEPSQVVEEEELDLSTIDF